MDNKDIIDALEKIPALIQAAETFKGTTNHIIATFSEELKKHSLAEIPEEGMSPRPLVLLSNLLRMRL